MRVNRQYNTLLEQWYIRSAEITSHNCKYTTYNCQHNKQTDYISE